MKRIQSVLCASALAIALCSTVLAGNIHGVSATAPGNIHGVSAPGNIHGVSAPGDITGFLKYAAGILISSIAGNIHG